MAAKKATTNVGKATTNVGTEYNWYLWDARLSDTFADSYAWEAGYYPSVERLLACHEFSEFMDSNRHPERIYLLASAKDGKPHKFLRIEVKSSGYTYKEV
jgi:hypothetical protein